MNNDRVIDLYDMYADNVYKLAYSFIGSAADAEDIVQTVFLRLLQKNVKIVPDKEKSYLLKMTANACKDFLKSPKYKNVVPFEDTLEKYPDEHFSENEQELMNHLEKLPYKNRIVIHLFYYEGYSVREISKMLGISASAVTMRLTRGRNQLKESILKEGLI